MSDSSHKRIIIITGHYGCGKTSVAVNMAKQLCQSGQKVSLVDLDIVNPYFRSADFSEEMSSLGVNMVVPTYAKTNLDIPALTAGVDGVISDGEGTVILDVGGDDTGAVALGRYSALIKNAGYEMYYIVNAYRLLTHTPEEALILMRQIEEASRLTVSGLINNSNLGDATTAEEIGNTRKYMDEISALCGLPVVYTAADEKQKDKLSNLQGRMLWLNEFTLPQWARQDQ